MLLKGTNKLMIHYKDDWGTFYSLMLMKLFYFTFEHRTFTCNGVPYFYTVLLILLFKGPILCSCPGSYLYFGFPPAHVICFTLHKTLYFSHTICLIIPVFTLCLKHSILAPVFSRPPPEKAQYALIGHC